MVPYVDAVVAVTGLCLLVFVLHVCMLMIMFMLMLMFVQLHLIGSQAITR